MIPWNMYGHGMASPVRAPAAPAPTPPARVAWFSDLVRVQIAIWDRVDRRLKDDHDLSLPFFEVLHFLSTSPAGLRVGDLAERIGITVGGTSKLVDRVERAGLLARTPDPDDRRASRLGLTEAGAAALAAATATYDDEVAAAADPVLSAAEQETLHGLVRRLLAVDRPEARA